MREPSDDLLYPGRSLFRSRRDELRLLPASELSGHRSGRCRAGQTQQRGGALPCNATYVRNIGVQPVAIDLSTVAADELHERLGLNASPQTDVFPMLELSQSDWTGVGSWRLSH